MLSIIKKLLKSIVLVPSVVVLAFVILSVIVILVGDLPSDNFVSKRIGITIKEDVQFILAFIIGGIFTLTIFSYTMVMNVLNRNINNFSPRLIPLILSEKHHQLILGFTTGTIVYSMIMAIAINTEPLDFPHYAAALGILFSIVCILLFIYFLHRTSQSIHVNYILKETYRRGSESIHRLKSHKFDFEFDEEIPDYKFKVRSNMNGYLKNYDYDKILKICEQEEIDLNILRFPGEYILKEEPLFAISKKIDKKVTVKLTDQIVVGYTVPFNSPYIGFKHLVEVAVKACSTAINDPGTSLGALQYITQLFIDFAKVPKYNFYTNGEQRVYIKHLEFSEVYHFCFEEMEHYMMADPILAKAIQKAKYDIMYYQNVKEQDKHHFIN